MGGNLQCVTTAKLPEGQITTQLRFRLVEGETTGSVAAVTGGTGAFATASGYVESQAIPGTSNATITFHLYP
jgi:hypothetical protein